MKINIKDSYPQEFEAIMPFKVNFSQEQGIGISCYIPMINAVFSAKNMEEAQKKARIMMISNIEFWEEENQKGVFKGVWK